MADTCDTPDKPNLVADYVVFRGKRLLRVLPIAQSEQIGNSDVTLICLEIYEDGCLLRYQTVGPGGLSMQAMMMRSMMHQEPAFRVEDDIGTEYRSFPAGGGGGDEVWRGEVQVTPIPPSEASLMTISVRQPLLPGLNETKGPAATFQVQLA